MNYNFLKMLCSSTLLSRICNCKRKVVQSENWHCMQIRPIDVYHVYVASKIIPLCFAYVGSFFYTPLVCFNCIMCAVLLVAFMGIGWLWTMIVAFPSHIDMLEDAYDVVLF